MRDHAAVSVACSIGLTRDWDPPTRAGEALQRRHERDHRRPSQRTAASDAGRCPRAAEDHPLGARASARRLTNARQELAPRRTEPDRRPRQAGSRRLAQHIDRPFVSEVRIGCAVHDRRPCGGGYRLERSGDAQEAGVRALHITYGARGPANPAAASRPPRSLPEVSSASSSRKRGDLVVCRANSVAGCETRTLVRHW